MHFNPDMLQSWRDLSRDSQIYCAYPFLIPCIPLQHHIIQLKFVHLFFSIIKILNFLLQLGCVLENFFSGLLQMDHLIQSSLHRIIFTTGFLKKFDYQGCERGRKQVINSIHKFEWDIPMDFFWLTWSTQSALINFLCHLFLLISSSFLMMLTKDLLEDSTNPLPCGW